MDIDQEKEAFEKECRLLCYKGNMVMSNLGSFYNNEQTNWMWQMWLSAKAQAVPEGFVLVEKAKLMQIIGSVSMIEPITRGNPYMDSVKRELTAITDVVKTVIEAQGQK